MEKLSILIPAYNVEQWLSRCLNSILAQNTEDVEIIIVDDGSTDNTLQCAKKFSAKWNNIKVFSKNNEGVGAARNFLLDKAQGEYIWFVDSDDYIVDGCLTSILAELSGDLDLLSVAYNDVQQRLFEGKGIDYIKEHLINGYLWSKIIKRKIIEEASIRFESKRCSQEDWFFLMHVYPLLTYVKQIPLKAYVYCDDNKQSVMRGIGVEHKKKLVADSLETICNFKVFINEIRNEPYVEVYKQWMNTSVAGFLYSLFPIDYSLNEIKRDIEKFRERGIYPVGKTGKNKIDLFLKVVNHEGLYLFLVKLYRILRINES